MATYMVHSKGEQAILQKASLSTQTELDEDEKDRLEEMMDEWLHRLDEVSGVSLRYYIMPTQRPGHGQPSDPEDELPPQRSKPGKPQKAKREPTEDEVAELAALRRSGGTWADVDSAAGFHKSSTDWRILFEAHGFDKLGRPGGKGTSKAKGAGVKGMKAKPRKGKFRKKRKSS